VLDLSRYTYLKLVKIGDARYYVPKSLSLTTKKVGPYRIL